MTYWVRPESGDIQKIFGTATNTNSGIGLFVELTYRRTDSTDYSHMTVKFDQSLINQLLEVYSTPSKALYITLLGTDNYADFSAKTYLAKVTNPDVNAYDFCIVEDHVSN